MGAAQAVLGAFGIDAQALAGITVMTREVRHATVRVTQRHDRHFVPKQAAVFAIVAQQYAAGFSSAQRIAQAVAAILLPVVRLEQAQISSRKFASRIAGQRLEGGVNINHRVILALGIDQHQALRRALNQAPV